MVRKAPDAPFGEPEMMGTPSIQITNDKKILQISTSSKIINIYFTKNSYAYSKKYSKITIEISL